MALKAQRKKRRAVLAALTTQIVRDDRSRSILHSVRPVPATTM
jgi:hypothetical protein